MEIISTQEELDILTALLDNTKRFAVDTEFVRDTFHYPRMSLIQFGLDKETFVVDLTCGANFSELKNILSSPNHEKIIHSSSQDILGLENFLKIKVNGVLDTQIAAVFTGLKEMISLADLSNKIVGVKINKDQQYSSWLNRPLSLKQRMYAHKDVLHLVEIYKIMEEQLVKADRLSWFLEEMKLQDESELLWFRVVNNPTSPKQLSRIMKILSLRDSYAKSYNISVNKLISCADIKKLVQDNNFNIYVSNIIKQEVLDIINSDEILEEAMKICTALKAFHHNTLKSSRIADKLKFCTKTTKLPNSFILPKPRLMKIICGLEYIPINWRYELIEDKILDVLSK